MCAPQLATHALFAHGYHSTYVYFNESTRASFVACEVYFGSVPTDQLGLLDEKFKTSLKKIVADGFDMERMRVILKRDKLKVSLPDIFRNVRFLIYFPGNS